MRILVLHSVYRSGEASGENRVVLDEIRLLEQAGHRVDTWLPTVDEETPLRIVGGRAVWSRKAVRHVNELLSESLADVIHLHNLFPNLSPGVIRSTRRVPVVMTLHNFRLLCLPATLLRDGQICEDCVGRSPWPGVLHRCYRGSRLASGALAGSLALHTQIGTFDSVDLFLPVSEFIRDKHVKAGFDPSRFRVKPNWVSNSVRRVGPGEYFLFLGRVSPEKGVATAIQACFGEPLMVIGEGPDRKQLQALAAGNVTFTGPLDSVAVSEIVGRARALLVPSRWYEGQPRVILEAFAAGVPVVASRIGGLPDLVVDGVNGLLADPDSDAEWRAAVVRLLRDGESERLGTGALRTWESRFTPASGLANLEMVYREAIGRATA